MALTDYNDAMSWLSRLGVVYLMALSYLLLVSNPFAMAGEYEETTKSFYFGNIASYVHVICFVPLGFAAVAGRWPWRRSWVLFSLVIYAVGTEFLQAIIPERVMDGADMIQNLAGLAVGMAMGWLGLRVCSTPETRSD